MYKVTYVNNEEEYFDNEILCYRSYVNIGRKDKLKTYLLSDIINDYKRDCYTRGKRYDKYLYFHKLPDAIEYSRVPHTISPYALGVLLAEGCLGEVSKRNSLEIASEEIDIVERMMSGAGLDNYTFNGEYNYSFPQYKNINVGLVKQEIIRMGIDKPAIDKFIPNEYLEDSIENRKELLRGLVDTDGTLATKKNQKNYHVMYCTTSPELYKTIERLVIELGYGINTSHITRDNSKWNDIYEIRIYTPDIIWSSKKNYDKIIGKEYRSNQHICTAIKNIEKV